MNNADMQQIRDTLAASFPFKATAKNDAYQQGIAVCAALKILDAALARDEKPVVWMKHNERGEMIAVTQHYLDNLQLGWQWIAGQWTNATPLYLRPPETTEQSK